MMEQFRDNILNAIFSYADVLSEKPQCDAIVQWLFPDLYAFDDYQETIDFLVQQEIDEIFDNPYIKKQNYDDSYNECYENIKDGLTVSDFEINGKFLIWQD